MGSAVSLKGDLRIPFTPFPVFLRASTMHSAEDRPARKDGDPGREGAGEDGNPEKGGWRRWWPRERGLEKMVAQREGAGEDGDPERGELGGL